MVPRGDRCKPRRREERVIASDRENGEDNDVLRVGKPGGQRGDGCESEIKGGRSEQYKHRISGEERKR
jgi:hypothetical protein